MAGHRVACMTCVFGTWRTLLLPLHYVRTSQSLQCALPTISLPSSLVACYSPVHSPLPVPMRAVAVPPFPSAQR
jgi:hypothetical protein